MRTRSVNWRVEQRILFSFFFLQQPKLHIHLRSSEFQREEWVEFHQPLVSAPVINSVSAIASSLLLCIPVAQSPAPPVVIATAEQSFWSIWNRERLCRSVSVWISHSPLELLIQLSRLRFQPRQTEQQSLMMNSRSRKYVSNFLWF